MMIVAALLNLPPIPITCSLVILLLILTLTPLKFLQSSELSWIWSHFEKLENKTLAFCCLCHKEVFYSKCYSTGMLIHHVNVHHKAVSSQHLKSVADTVPRLELDSKRQGTVNPSLILSISLRPAL